MQPSSPLLLISKKSFEQYSQASPLTLTLGNRARLPNVKEKPLPDNEFFICNDLGNCSIGKERECMFLELQ